MMNRRQVMRAAATAAAAFTIVPRHVLGGPKFVAPSDKINIALIGAGGQGRSNLRILLKEADCQVIAVADPAESFSLQQFYYKDVGGRDPTKKLIEEHYQQQTPNFKCSVYEDFRELLEKETAVDAVLCATPDHLHATISIAAMRAGKHVYCEKPLTHNIWEARQVAKVAAETGLATQMGNQGHSTHHMRQTVEVITSGMIGTVREVHAWVSGNRWNPTLQGKPTESVAVPAGLNWDLWLGPREPRPFHPAYFPVAWRDFWAFGGSNIGDFGCHDLDAACWALDLHAPEWVEFHPAGHLDSEIAPHGSHGCYHFPATANRPPVKVFWYDGGLKPTGIEGLPPEEKLSGRGVLFVGDRGSVVTAGAGGPLRLFLADGSKDPPLPPETLTRSRGHHRDWFSAIRGEDPASSHFGYGARLTEIALLGVLALRAGERIHWDAENMVARGLDRIQPWIREPVRPGWEI